MSICLGLFLVQRFLFPENIQSYLDEEHDSHETPPSRVRYAFIMTMCGIHGTISLSMALTLPFIITKDKHSNTVMIYCLLHLSWY